MQGLELTLTIIGCLFGILVSVWSAVSYALLNIRFEYEYPESYDPKPNTVWQITYLAWVFIPWILMGWYFIWRFL